MKKKRRRRRKASQRRERLWKLSESQNWRCAYCGIIIEFYGTNSNNNKATVDHVIPLSRHGLDRSINMVAACAACNEIRSNEDAYLYYRWRNKIESFSDRPFLIQISFNKRYKAIHAKSIQSPSN